MKKLRLFGSKILSDHSGMRIPEIITLDENEDLNKVFVKDGDLLDANSIKSIIPKNQPEIQIDRITNQIIDELFD